MCHVDTRSLHQKGCFGCDDLHRTGFHIGTKNKSISRGRRGGSSGADAAGVFDFFLLLDTKVRDKLPQHLLAGRQAKLSKGRCESRWRPALHCGRR